MPQTIDREISQLAAHAESIANDALRVFDDAAWQPGDVASQGDLYLVCLHKMPESAKPRKNKQMADGDTQGSRHILTKGKAFDADSGELCRMIEFATKCSISAKYIGPVFRGPALLTHPEHGDQQWTGKCFNVVVYQRALDAEQREQMVVD